MNVNSSKNITDLDFVRADVKVADYLSKKGLNVFMVFRAGVLIAAEQHQHDVGLGCAFTLRTWRTTEDCEIQYT